jgi:ribonuclease P protein component
VHYLPPEASSAGASGDPLVGFVVGRSVGNSVVRHRVTRRLRAAARDELDRLPGGSRTVVRALPAAHGRHAAELAADLDAALGALLRGVRR